MLRLLQWLMSRERLLRRLDPLMGGFNPFLPEHRANPYATWRRLREESPVFRSRAFGAFLLTRYDDVVEVLQSPNFTSDRSSVPVFRLIAWLSRGDPDFRGLIDRNLLMLDGAEHRRLRGLVSKAFTPRRIEALRPRIEGLVDGLLEACADKGRIDLIGDYAQPLPVTVIAELLGVPAEDRHHFHRWSAVLVQLLDPFQGRGGGKPLRQANRELNAYFRPLLAARREAPRDDLLSAMLAAEQDGDRLSEWDLLALSSLLLVAGHETTTNLIGNAMVALLRHPGERKRLIDEPELMPTAVEEFLRFDSPIQLTDRVATADVEIGGQAIRRGQVVGTVLAAANHDPAVFAEPERLDVARTPNRHMAFSHGAHYCLGAQLARLETEIAVGALVRRFPDLRGPVDPPAWRRSMILRGPVALPLQLV